MECNTKKNLEKCTCTYESCHRRGSCCECISYHVSKRELTGCCFPAEAERTYDRSFKHFADLVAQGKA